MYGEWLAAKHTYFYDALPHYFMEFDVLDTQTNTFLSTDARRELLSEVKVTPVLVLGSGNVHTLKELGSFVKRSNFITKDRAEHLKLAAMGAGVDVVTALAHTDMSDQMEGLYIKWEEDGVVKGRYKFVRESFTSTIMDSETHWHDRPIINNRLQPGALELMFT